jgi:hypothetical protein
MLIGVAVITIVGRSPIHSLIVRLRHRSELILRHSHFMSNVRLTRHVAIRAESIIHRLVLVMNGGMKLLLGLMLVRLLMIDRLLVIDRLLTIDRLLIIVLRVFLLMSNILSGV